MILNTAALDSPQLIDQVASAYGAQCVVLSLDVRLQSGNDWRVWTDSGRIDSGLHPLTWAEEAVKRGAGEVMVTSIDRDGSGSGLELRLISLI